MQFSANLSGGRHVFEALAEPIRLGDSAGGILVIRDITDRDVLRLQTEFLAMASHELRNPIAAVRVIIEVVLQLATPEGDPRMTRLLEQGLAQCQMLTALVQDLTDAMRLQAGQFQVEPVALDLVTLTANAVDTARTVYAREIDLTVTPSSLFVRGGARRLQQVVDNLLGNAIQHAPESPVSVRLRQDGQEAVLEIADQGPGIPPENLSRVFTRFYRGPEATTSQVRGLGLGLYIVYEIVSAHHGRVDVTSTLGHGATFTVRLPLPNNDSPPGLSSGSFEPRADGAARA